MTVGRTDRGRPVLRQANRQNEVHTMTNMIQSAKDQVAALTQAAYERAAAAGVLPAGAEAPFPISLRRIAFI